MESNTITSRQIMINYGVILGTISIATSAAVYATGNAYNQHWSVGVVSFAITAATIVLGIKKYKKINNNTLQIVDAIKVGLGISLIAGILASIYSYIFLTVIEPEFFNNLALIQEQKWIDQGLSDKEIENALVMMRKMSGAFMTTSFTLVGSLFMGFIIAVISGAIMKKSNEEITSI